MSNYDKTDQHRYPYAQTKADRKLLRSKVWRSKIWPALIGSAVGLIFAFLIASVIRSDREEREQQRIDRQHWHEVGIADCKEHHGIIQLDRLGWYVGCLVNTTPPERLT